MKSKHIYRLGAVALNFVSCIVGAQDSGTEAGKLEEIVVTAQRRQERLQDVPLAVSAVTEKGLADAGVPGTEALVQVVPGLVLSQASHTSTPFLRGIGNSSLNPGNDPSVAFYIDGVYQSAPTALLFSFNNIERVEVLKGPQGTLFGRNATGGLVNVVTKDPVPGFEGTVDVGYGNFETFKSNLYVSGGNDRIAADLGVVFTDSPGGWGKNLATPDQAGPGGVYTLAPGATYQVPAPRYSETGFINEIGVRSKIVANITEDSKLKLSLGYSRNHTDRSISRRGLPGALLSANGVTPYTFTGDFWDETSENSYQTLNRQYSAAAEFTQDFGKVTFKSITSYLDALNRAHLPSDSTPQVSQTNAHPYQPTKTFTQELQLLNNDGPIDWIGGLYFLNSTAEWEPSRFTVGEFLEGSFDLIGSHETTSAAAFGQATFNVAEHTRLTLGGRYTADRFEAWQYNIGTRTIPTASPQFANGSITNQVPTQTHETNAVSWRVALDHKITPDILAYASVSRGYKSGGFNVGGMCSTSPAVVGTCPAIAPPYEPEYLLDYSVGLKMDVFDNRVRLNIAGFYYDYKDVQVQSIVGIPPVTLLINAAAAELYGAEIELQAAVTDHLSVNGNVALLHSEYEEFDNAVTTVPRTGAPYNNVGIVIPSVAGNALNQAPEMTANTGFTYGIDTSLGTLEFAGNYYYNSGFYWEASNRLKQKAYDLINGSISLSPTDDWRVRLWATNLANEKHFVYMYASSSGDQVAAAAPRSYGIEIRHNFR